MQLLWVPLMALNTAGIISGRVQHLEQLHMLEERLCQRGPGSGD